MQSNNAPVNIVVAHPLEAKALISMLGLRSQQSASGYAQYGNSNGLQLIVSGIGKPAVSDAVTFLAGQQFNDDGQVRAWLNIGIAGHRDAALGSGWLVNKITDKASGSRAYPPQLIGGIAACGVVTVDGAERVYPQDAVYEMEASAFYEEASRYSTAELVQLFKIVSDNLDNPVGELDLKQVPVWIAQAEEQITSLIRRLSDLVNLYNASQAIPTEYHELCARLRLSVSQKLQLKRLCQRYRALGRESELGGLITSAADNRKQLIDMLASKIDHPMNTQ